MGSAVAEKTVVCVHSEAIKDLIGTCSICGQIREYDFEGKLRPNIIKRGQIDGVLTDVIPVVNRRSVQKEVPSPPSEQAIQILKPPDWDKMGKFEKKEWFEEHREEILKDVRDLGELKARKRWDIRSPTWVGLKRRWGFGVTREGAHGNQKEVLRHPRKKKLQAYFEKNKEAIIKDYNTMLRRDFLKKWHLGTQTWIRLQKEWKVPYKMTRRQQEFILPEFPAFSDKWGDSVQVKWLETYPILLERENGNGRHILSRSDRAT